jgi:transcriptional regulator of acetoin/glycerol metabolism
VLEELNQTTQTHAPTDPAARGPQNLDELSRSAIRTALENSRGNISLAARCLGISRQTLYRKLHEGATAPQSASPMTTAEGKKTA